MASLDKEGLYYVKEDPQLGKIRGLDPWAVENGIHLIRMEQDAAEGIMMIRKSNQQQYGTVHGGVLVAFADTIAGHSLAPHGRMCVTQGSTVNFLRPAAGAYLFCPAVFLNSAQWGQADSFCTAILLGSLLLLCQERYIPSAVLYGLSIACKPQMFYLLPPCYLVLSPFKPPAGFRVSAGPGGWAAGSGTLAA